MRDIKFRGKPIDEEYEEYKEYEEKFVYGFLIQRYECETDIFGGVKLDFNREPVESIVNYIYVQNNDEEYDFESGMVKVKNVGQYTGLKDKNGKDIYEGDILNVQHCNIWKETNGYNKVKKIVSFADGKFGFMNNEGYLSKIKTLDDITIFDFEVIGNIHENKETIK